MSEEMETFIYLLHCCADNFDQQNAAELLRKWDEMGITQVVFDKCARRYTTDEEAMEAIITLLEQQKEMT